MTPKTELEITGTILVNPFADVAAEIYQHRLSGSLRVSNKEQKAVVYFKSGRAVFAVSNSRVSRLFNLLLERKRLQKKDLAKIPNYQNDFELVAFLEGKNLIGREELDKLFIDQIEGILVDILSWDDGEWQFTSLARIRDGLAFEIDLCKVLAEFGRCLSQDKVLRRFRSLDESFERSNDQELRFNLTSDEAFVLSRADSGSLTAGDIARISTVSESAALHLIYTLWLAGLLVRNEWQAALPDSSVLMMQSARLELKREAKQPVAVPAEKQHSKPRSIVTSTDTKVVEPITVDEYLNRVENAKTHYEVLGVSVKAPADEIKQAYFSMARMFHPDKFHAQGGETLKRLQHAFTELSQAHETLKNEETREIYNYRMRKEIADEEKRRSSGSSGSVEIEREKADQNFERGLNLLMDNDHEAALPFLARAVHFAPDNARYHAYYGKALAADDQRHKAESEMQAALKLDPDNPNYRLLLAEFFVKVNLRKRAEGELNRLLAIYPSNHEAQNLLTKIRSEG